MKRFLFLMLAVLSPLALWAQAPNQLVTISSNGKYLVNSITGQPVFIVGDDAFDLCCMLNSADAKMYLTDRANKGFNAIWMAAADNGYSSNPPKNFNGNSPFDGADFTNEDANYWANLDSIISEAQSLGITVFLNPFFTGNGSESGYLNSVLASSDATMSAYGTFLGQRYTGFTNIVWLLGGDALPSTAGLYQKLNVLGAAIAAADPNHLITFEACEACITNGYNSASAFQAAGLAVPSWLKLNWAYPQTTTTIPAAQNVFNQSPFFPPLCGENYYELEHSLTELNVRFEQYSEILSGCYAGRIFGNGAIWSFNSPNGSPCCPGGSPTWQSQLSSTGSISQGNQGRLFRSREHWLLVPDISHSVLTAGFGSGLTMTTAARTSDGQTIIAYLPDGNATAKTISMSSIVSSSSTAVAWWYAPLTGTATLIGTFPNSGSQSFTAPDGNDWVLVIDDDAANLGAPGGGTGNNPVPSITSLNPSSATAGGSAFTLTVNGSGFISSSVVNFNGSARTTTFVSATQIKASILASDIATSGTANVTVTNPAPGGGTTPNVTFTISNASNPVPTLASISPTSGALGQSVALTLTGTNFISSSIVNFASNQNTGGVVSNGGNTLTITIPAAQLATAGPVSVTVTNPTPGGGTTGAQTFTVNNSAGPSITTIAPPSANAGGAAFTLTVTGTGFVSGAVVKFNGTAKTTTFVSATQVTAAIAAADIVTAGTVNVAVTNPAPGGGTSGNIQFTINNPNVTVTSLSPASATAGGAGFTLTINGSGFASGATVNFGGNPAITPSSVTSTQIVATIPAADIAAGGTANVTVTNPGGVISSAQTFAINNPAPTTSSLSPTSAIAGGASFTLTVNGTGFVPGSIVKFNGVAKATSFVGSTQITAAITTADIATAGPVSVTVTNPAPGGGTSNAQTFTINNSSNLTITSLSPASATAGGAAFTLTVNGTGFVSGATMQFNGANRTTTFVSSTQVTAAILAADIATAGTASVTVTNPAPSGGTSNAQTFTINGASNLTITSLSPSSTTAGAAAFTLTVNGTGFLSGAVVKFGGVAKTTTFKSATQLTAAIAASDIASGGVQSITVTNPAPGGGTSGAATFTVNNTVPTLSSLSPASVFAGSGAFTLTVNGTGFVNGASLQFNGAGRTTTFVSSTQVTTAILASDIAATGTVNVTVTNPSPTTGPSASLALNITNENNPVPAISALDTTHVTGGSAFTLMVNGSSFEQKSVVNLNGKAEATTFVSTTRISAAIPASDVAVAGSMNVTVTNPAPGGGTSSAFAIVVDGYTVGGSSTASVASGQPATLQITVTPTASGFSNPVAFSISGLPSGVSALFAPMSVTPGGKAATTMLTITDGSAAASRAKSQAGISGGGIAPTLLFGVIVLLAWLGFETRGRSIPEMRHYATVGLFVFMLIAGSVLGGCALGVTSSPSSQTSRLTVTATSGTMTQTFGITLTVTH